MRTAAPNLLKKQSRTVTMDGPPVSRLGARITKGRLTRELEPMKVFRAASQSSGILHRVDR
jgi:hypothetical protein